MKNYLKLGVLIFSILLASQVLAGLSDSLVAYYPFTGNATDSSGNGNDGTNNGATPSTDRFGNANSAMSFDGASDYINTGLNVIGFAEISINAWVKTQNVDIHDGIVLSMVEGVNVVGLSADNPSSIIRSDCGTTGTDTVCWGEAPWKDYSWHLLSMTYDGSIHSLYFDGILIDSSLP